MFNNVIDRFKGYFDNFRSDAYFRSVKISDITMSRMNSWSNRNFRLVNLETITKVQTKALNNARLNRVMNDDSQWKHVAAKLSKAQILSLRYDESKFASFGSNRIYESKIASFSTNKLYKLFSTGRISERFAYDHLLTVVKNPQMRTEVITKGFEFGFFSKEMSSLDYLNLIMNQPLERILPYLSKMKTEHITPEIANVFISKLNLYTLTRLNLVDNTMIEKIWEVATTKLTDLQREDIRSYIKSSLSYGDFNFLKYLPLNEGFIDTQVIEILRLDLQQHKPQAVKILSTLTTSKINYLWDYAAEEIAPHLMLNEFVKLAQNNAFRLCDHLGPKYGLFLSECSPEIFQSIWNHCPQLHAYIINNCRFDPDLVIDNVDPKNLYQLVLKYPNLFQKHPEKFLDEHLVEFIDSFNSRLDKPNLTCSQVLHYLTNARDQKRKENLFLYFFNIYKTELIKFDSDLSYIKKLPEASLDGCTEIEGLRERLANHWDGENQAHVYLGALFNFSPKDFPSSKWFMYCDKMSSKAFDTWIKTAPKLSNDHFLNAIRRLQLIEKKTYLLRGRELWDLDPNRLVNLHIFPSVFPLKNWTPEIYQKYGHAFIKNLILSLEYKLDKSDTILEASKCYKEGIISLLTWLSRTGLKRSKRFETCLKEWNKWAIEDFKMRSESPQTNLKLLQSEVDHLVKSNFITLDSRQQMQLILDKKNGDKFKSLLENPNYVSLKKELTEIIKAIEESHDNRIITSLFDAFAEKYAKVKEILIDDTIFDKDLESMKKFIKEKRVEMDREMDIFAFFAPLHTLNVKEGITPDVMEKNRAILDKAYKSDCIEIGDLESKSISDGVSFGSVMVRDELGKVDLPRSLARIDLAFP